MNRPDPAPTVEVRRLTKYYGPFVAVRDVSFSARQGEVVTLLGPNGAGKTTIMRMLTGFVSPSKGMASIAGQNVDTDRLAAAAHVGYLPENGPLYPDMTPLELLRFFGEARGLTRAALRARIDAVADQCDIRLILDKPVGQLSKGLRQRVGMAQALLHDPDVLIMDEPTAGLDPIQIRHFRDQLRQLGRSKTVLVSTHILQEVAAIADRVLVIDNGLLIFDGTVQDFSQGGSLDDRFYALVRRKTETILANKAST